MANSAKSSRKNQPLPNPIATLEQIRHDPAVKDTEYRLLSILNDLADHRGIAFAPVTRLMRITGKCRRSVRYIIADLVHRQLIFEVPIASAGGPRRLALSWHPGSQRFRPPFVPKVVDHNEPAAIKSVNSGMQKTNRTEVGIGRQNFAGGEGQNFAPGAKGCPVDSSFSIPIRGKDFCPYALNEALRIIENEEHGPEKRKNALQVAAKLINSVLGYDDVPRWVFSRLWEVARAELDWQVVFSATINATTAVLDKSLVNIGKIWNSHIAENRKNLDFLRESKNHKGFVAFADNLELAVKDLIVYAKTLPKNQSGNSPK